MRPTFVLFSMIIVVAACGDDNLIDARGLPSQLAKVPCGASTNDLIHAYPELMLEQSDTASAVYCRVTPGVEKVCVFVVDGHIAVASVYFMAESPQYAFGSTLKRLEHQLGEGKGDPVRKKFTWTEGTKLVTLTGTTNYTALAVNCP